MEDIGKAIAQITLGPYIAKAMALVGKRRKAGSNMFRHQLDTMTILLDYKIIDPVLLKAAVIHDLFEEARGFPGVTREEITAVDSDGEAVFDLVMEVTLRENNGLREPKGEFLRRIMEHGSTRAKMLKLADRISNLVSLGFVHDERFVHEVLLETRQHILPYAEAVNPNMHREMCDLVADREQKLLLRGQSWSPAPEACHPENI
jgi:(p)ppGpp synthase/HD superfamily hydrolase